jgi:uncharacterized protein (TIGR02246 family)
LASVVAVSCSCLAAGDRTTADALSARWMAAYNSGDARALAAMYATDARMQEGYCQPVDGRDAIEAYWKDDVAEGGLRTRLYVHDTFELDELVYVSGDYSVEGPHADSPRVGGAFTHIWRRGGDSEWRLYRESWANLACLKLGGHVESTDDEKVPRGIDL